MRCINLKKKYGYKYHIQYDPVIQTHTTDPWMFTIPGRIGTIFPFGGKWLGLEIIGHSKTRAKLIKQKVKCIVNGDEEGIYKFHVDDFLKFARIAKSRTKKKLSASHLAKMQEGLRRHKEKTKHPL